MGAEPGRRFLKQLAAKLEPVIVERKGDSRSQISRLSLGWRTGRRKVNLGNVVINESESGQDQWLKNEISGQILVEH